MATTECLTSILNQQTVYVIPDYQRDYSWKKNEILTLLDDIFDLMTDGTLPHFIGAFVTVDYDSNESKSQAVNLQEKWPNLLSKNICNVVDGQQRLTTILVFVRATMDMVQNDDDLPEQKRLMHHGNLAFLLQSGPVNSEGKRAPSLVLNGPTGIYFNNIITDSQDKCDRTKAGYKRLKTCFEICKNYLRDKRDSWKQEHDFSGVDDFYEKLYIALTTKLEMVKIQCDKSANAFQVFDSLNGKGLNLTAADRIKNKLFSWNEKDSTRTQIWNSMVAYVKDDHLVDFFSALLFFEEGKRISKNLLPSHFGAKYENAARASYHDFIQWLEERAEIYGKIRNGEGLQPGPLKNIFNDLSCLSVDQIYTILFAAATKYKIDLDSQDEFDFQNFASACLKLVVRVQVCESPVNRLDNYFGNIIGSMKSGASLPDITKQVLNLIDQKIANEDQFKQKFETFSPVKSSVSEFYLRKIENYLRRKNGNRNELSAGKTTVEHIIPQTVSDLKIWYETKPIPPEIQDNPTELLIERLGNKALLFVDDNAACGNRGYNYKKEVYTKGKKGATSGNPYDTFELIHDLIDKYPDHFTHEEINDRQKQMAEIASKLW